MKTDTFVQLVCQEDDDEGTMVTRSSTIPHQIAVQGRPETEQDDEVQTTVTLLTTEQNDEEEEEEVENTATSTTLKQEEDDETASLSVGEEDGDNNNVNEEGNTAGNRTYTWRGIARNVGIVAAVAGGSVATAGLALTVAGFGASGIVGGSIAACVQSSIGNVAAGSLFATLQSAGATGSIAVCTSAGAATAAAGGTAAALSGRGNDTASHP
mmetsp:Transcript_8965/g.16916  ORF Transcript_8965/g.16916 Transcript_8965/m.16916 type:complete len:212 (-) Transcript_8965:2700-3335(-)